MLGMTAFALQDTVIRLLAVDISILQVMFARSIVALILLTLFLKITKKEIILKTAFPLLSIFRTVMFILAFVFYYIGLHYLTFAEATALFFTAPFFITIFSITLLNALVNANLKNNRIIKKYLIFFWILHLKLSFSISQTHLIFQFELNFLAFDA